MSHNVSKGKHYDSFFFLDDAKHTSFLHISHRRRKIMSHNVLFIFDCCAKTKIVSHYFSKTKIMSHYLRGHTV